MRTHMDAWCRALEDAQVEYDVYNFSDLHKDMLKKTPNLDKLAMDNHKHLVVLARNKLTFWFDDAGNLSSIEPKGVIPGRHE